MRFLLQAPSIFKVLHLNTLILLMLGGLIVVGVVLKLNNLNMKMDKLLYLLNKKINKLIRLTKPFRYIEFFILNTKTKGAFMEQTIKRHQFTTEMGTDGTTQTGRQFITVKAKPKEAATGREDPYQKGTLQYVGNNDAVGTVEPNKDDETLVNVIWVGAGKMQLQSTADADPSDAGVTTISGTIDLTFEEDQDDTIDLSVVGLQA